MITATTLERHWRKLMDPDMDKNGCQILYTARRWTQMRLQKRREGYNGLQLKYVVNYNLIVEPYFRFYGSEAGHFLFHFESM